MKRRFLILFVLFLLLPSLALADVIVEPENGFFRTHREDCSHIGGRTYLAEGPDGSLPLYTAPNGTAAKTVPNGEAFFCEWIYTDHAGTVWGYSNRHELWAPLGLTAVQYDDAAFRAEYGAEIVPNDGRRIPEEQPVALYSYPGAPDPYLFEIGGVIPGELYVDGLGRTWGSVGYHYGFRNKWICLDDPANEDLGSEPKDPVPSGFAAPASLPSGSRTGAILCAVGGVAVVTAAVILILFRKKKRAPEKA